MEIMLAENIRKQRKEKSLTQEQLAEVLGVTAGAVYKWEAKLSVPDIELIMRMADFFDTSVDVLLGYGMKDNRYETTVKRLKDYRRRKDSDGLQEAEKALKKYPHSFAVVRECAELYSCFGFESGDMDLLRRALELQEQSRLLLSQNTDPRISEQTIYGQMATILLKLDKADHAIELLKTHNAGGLHNHMIGHTLALCGRTDEAEPYLSEALSGVIGNLINTIIGYINVYGSRDDHDSMQAILRLGIGFLSCLRDGGKPNYLEKVNSGFQAALAGSQFLCGQLDDARITLEQARRLAEFFDASPSYTESDIRFLGCIEGASSAYDDIGATAMDTVGNVVKGFENEAISALWKEVAGEKEGITHE